MNPQDSDRIRFVTGHFTELQGLRKIPLGLAMLSLGFLRFAPGLLRLPLSLIALVGVLPMDFRPLTKYYRNRFGEVELPQRPSRNRREYLPGLAFMALGVGGALFVPGDSYQMVLRMLYALFGGTFFCTWSLRGHRLSQGHYLVLGLLFLGLEAPGTSSACILPALTTWEHAQMLFGAALILAGLLDHRQLVQALGPPEAPFLEAEAASQVKDQR